MMEQLRANIKKEKEILNYLFAIERASVSPAEREFYSRLYISLAAQMKILNSAIPGLIADIPEFEKKIEKIEGEKKRIVTVQGNLSVSRKDKEDYLKQVRLEDTALKSLKKRFPKTKEVKAEYYKEAGGYTKTSSRLFSGLSLSLAKSEIFKPLGEGIKKANMAYLLSTYISMMLFSSMIAFFAMVILAPFMIFSEMISPALGITAIFVVPLIVIIAFYAYPSSEASSTKTKINDEMPFAVMHMSAIAGSGIEPSKVFGILATSNEYPSIRKEMMKIMNQLNFYGYNLVSALRATAKTTSSDRFANVLNGIATTISSGGDLKEYLNKIAADTLLDYKLRRKRFTTISETYADIYTGLLVAAPLMFMLILVLMNVIGGGIGGMDPGTLALIGIGVLVIVNIGFLVFLQFSQPES